MKPTDEMVEAGARWLAKREHGQRYEGYESSHAETATGILTAALATHQEEGAPLGHVTRISDSSLYDEVCESCGATDEQLKLPCPFAEDNTPTPPAGLGKAVEAKRSDAFVFDPGSLTICGSGHAKSEGNGYFQFDEEDLAFYPHDEKEGSFIRIHLEQSELVELRDFLVRRFPSALRDGEAGS